VTRSALLVGAVAVAVALPALRGGFVYDDVFVVAQDARIRALHPRLLAVPYWGGEVQDRIWRPATTLSFAGDWAAGGGRPVAFHLTNLALHALVSVLVLLLAGRVLAAPGALAAGLVFAAHPVHVEAFAPVVGRSELLAAAGYLAAVLAYARDAAVPPGSRARPGWTLLALAAAAIAFGAKEHALTLPAALLLSDWWEARRTGERFTARWRRHALLWAAVVTVAAGYFAARAAVLGSALGAGNIAPGLAGLGAPARALVMLPAALVWLRLLVFPLHLAADYGPAAFVPLPSFAPVHGVSLAVLAAAALAVWLLRRRAPALTFALLWFAVTAAVAANVLVPTGVLLAERVLYLPSVAAAIAAGALVDAAAPARVTWPAATVLVTLLAARAMARAPDWRDEDRFFAALERDAPDSYRTWWGRGARAFESGDPAGGEQAYLRAVALHPDPALMQELGGRYFAAGLWAPADRWLTRAWEADPARGAAAVQAVVARLRAGRAADAASLGEAALARADTDPVLLVATADAWRALDRPVRALTLQRRAAYAEPGNWGWQLVAAEGAARAGRCAEARTRAERARALAPDALEPPRLLARLADGPTCGLTP
jgi:tetratricopeptide (TPR) repeat protein